MSRHRLPAPPVRVGQVWEDRQIKRPPEPTANLFTGAGPFRRFIILGTDPQAATVESDVGHRSRIALDRLRPTRKGYHLLREARGTPAAPQASAAPTDGATRE